MLEDKIQSIRQTISGGYTKPSKEHNEQLQKDLQENHDALEYLRKRGLVNDTIEHFQLGYDKDRNAISIPVFKHGELVNIRYRSLDPNTEKRYTQEKGCEVWLYNEDGIDIGIEKKGVLVVEGEFDLMSVWQNGIKNVISPASGKDSYGVWIELLDKIQRVYIAYDNDKPGKTAGYSLADRIGIDKCFEVTYPEGIKDANDFFLSHNLEKFKSLLKKSTPYYKHQYQGVGDVVNLLTESEEKYLQLDFLPYVRIEDDWVIVMSGKSNAGKTTYALNIVNELAEKELPVLVLPFERGIKTVGKRFIQIRYRKQIEDIDIMTDEEWNEIRIDAAPLPIYFSMPDGDSFVDVVKRAKRLFNIKACVIDHLDYFVKGSEKVSKQADVIRKIKDLAQEIGVIFFVVHHLNKEGGKLNLPPTQSDLTGSSDIFKVPEVVALLHKREEGTIDVIIDKNKGEMGTRTFEVDMSTGVFEKGIYNHPLKESSIEDEDW